MRASEEYINLKPALILGFSCLYPIQYVVIENQIVSGNKIIEFVGDRCHFD